MNKAILRERVEAWGRVNWRKDDGDHSGRLLKHHGDEVRSL